MASLHQHPAAPLPMPAVARILGRYDRDKLEAFVSVAIDLMDLMDPDPDIELNGDEADGNGPAEDEFIDHNANWLGQPGCPIADPDLCCAHEDIGTDVSPVGRIGFDGEMGRRCEDAEQDDGN